MIGFQNESTFKITLFSHFRIDCKQSLNFLRLFSRTKTKCAGNDKKGAETKGNCSQTNIRAVI